MRGAVSHNSCGKVAVPAISLARIMEENKLDHIDFLKLDCEGSEYPIIYDSASAIWTSVNSLFVEVHPMDKEKRNFEYLRNFLETAGYTTTSEVAENGCFALYAVRL